MAFYDNFERLCNERGLTPTQVARENNLTQQTVSHWKTRGSTPKAETVQKLADYFGTTVDYLLGIPPLQTVVEQTSIGTEILDSETQEFLAFNNFLEDIGYRTTLDLGTFGDINPDHKWTLLDRRTGKQYFVSSDRLNRLLDNITSFTKYQINEMISELAEIPRYRRQDAPESPPATQEGKDTTPPPDVSETPPEGGENK